MAWGTRFSRLLGGWWKVDMVEFIGKLVHWCGNFAREQSSGNNEKAKWEISSKYTFPLLISSSK